MKPITHYWQSLNFVSVVLSPVSALFCLLVSLRRAFFRFGWLKSYSSTLPVIVVGNIYIGGNGKTPFVIWLAEQLKAAGYKPGIVSRGYGAVIQQESGQAWPRRVNLQHNIELFGDEPFLIHQSTQCPVIIDPVRTRAVQSIEHETDCDVIISDDGLQHYAMSRFIEINITDAKRLYGNGLCLPAGPLREGRGRLKSVDYIVYNISQCDSVNSMALTHDNAFTMAYETSLLLPLSDKTEESMTLNDLKGKIVHAVAGIGEPDNFFDLLKSYGLKVIEHPFADHYQYQKQDLIFEQDYPVLMTEKDAVKCGFLSLLDSSNYWYLPIKASIDTALAKAITERLKTFSQQ